MGINYGQSNAKNLLSPSLRKWSVILQLEQYLYNQGIFNTSICILPDIDRITTKSRKCKLYIFNMNQRKNEAKCYNPWFAPTPARTHPEA